MKDAVNLVSSEMPGNNQDEEKGGHRESIDVGRRGSAQSGNLHIHIPYETNAEMPHHAGGWRSTTCFLTAKTTAMNQQNTCNKGSLNGNPILEEAISYGDSACPSGSATRMAVEIIIDTY